MFDSYLLCLEIDEELKLFIIIHYYISGGRHQTTPVNIQGFNLEMVGVFTSTIKWTDRTTQQKNKK